MCVYGGAGGGAWGKKREEGKNWIQEILKKKKKKAKKTFPYMNIKAITYTAVRKFENPRKRKRENKLTCNQATTDNHLMFL